jgi:CubicO group peptidase (beta-lactamase class C family)
MVTATVAGTCAPEFAAVHEEFARNFAERDEVGGAVCVTVDGETVVDLWGGVADAATDRAWDADTRVVVYSSTKGATALCAHILADRGLLDLDAPVAQYWPEFATRGKEDAIVSMMLDHSVGVPALAVDLERGAMYDWTLMCELLANQEPWWTPGTRNGYHMMTFGWTVGELVRRVSGRSLGTFFREEVAAPLGLEFDIGLPEELEPTVAPIIPWIPAPDYDSSLTRALRAEPKGVTAMAMKNTMRARANPNERAYRAAELGAGGGVATARGLAGMYAPLSCGGGGLIEADTLARMGQVATATDDDAVLRIPTRFTLGFMKSMDNRRRVPTSGCSAVFSSDAFGHVGAGGSIGLADPAARMSFGYVMNRQGAGILLNDRGQSLLDAVYRSLGYQGDTAGVWRR